MKKNLMLFVSGLAVSATMFLALPSVLAENTTNAAKAAAGKVRYPGIEAAIRELTRAREELVHADHDFHGHKKFALEAVTTALFQLKQALVYQDPNLKVNQ